MKISGHSENPRRGISEFEDRHRPPVSASLHGDWAAYNFRLLLRLRLPRRLPLPLQLREPQNPSLSLSRHLHPCLPHSIPPPSFSSSPHRV
jgi:hypothetical protein